LLTKENLKLAFEAFETDRSKTINPANMKEYFLRRGQPSTDTAKIFDQLGVQTLDFETYAKLMIDLK